MKFEFIAQAPPKATDAPPASPASEPAPTAEELKDMQKNVFKSLGWGEPPPEAIAPPTPAAETPPTPAPAPAPAPIPAPQPTPAPTGPSALEIARETGAAIGREIRLSQPPPAPLVIAAQNPPFELAPDDAEVYDLALWLASRDAKHATLPQRLLEHLKKSYAYIDQWTAEHPGEEWKAEASEHDAFFNNNPTPIDAQLVSQAKIDRLVDQRVEERVKPLQQKITMAEQQELVQRATPQMRLNSNQAALLLIEEVSPELAAIFRGANGPVLTTETSAKLEQTDPIAHEVINRWLIGELDPLVTELERANIKGLNYTLDPRSNAIHAEIESYHSEAESRMESAPAEARVFEDGRTFKSRAEYERLTSQCADEAARRALEQRYRTLNTQELEEFIAAEIGRKAKGEIDRLHKKFGKTTPPAQPPAAAPPQPAAQPPAQPAAAGPSRSAPPSLSSASSVVSTPQPPGQGAKTKGEAAVDYAFRK